MLAELEDEAAEEVGAVDEAGNLLPSAAEDVTTTDALLEALAAEGAVEVGGDD